ncbi:MAG: hypothetical protein ACK5JR_08675, partial [Tropicimonas sp.]
MTNQFSTSTDLAIGPETSPEQLSEILAQAREGTAIPGVNFVAGGPDGVVLQSGAEDSAVLIQDDDIVLILPDSEIIVLLGAAVDPYVIRIGDDLVSTVQLREIATPQDGWADLAQVPRATAQSFADLTSGRDSGSGEAISVLAGDPLKGLPISPLLDPTDYTPLPPQDEFLGAAEGIPDSPAVPVIIGGPDSGINAIAVTLAETDAPVTFAPSQYATVVLVGENNGEFIQTVRLTLPGLPAGMSASAGSFSPQPDGTVTFVFNGSYAAYQALTLTFPEDFSTESRNDFTPGDLTATLQAETNFGDVATGSFPVTVTQEGDVEIDATLPDTIPDETDAASSLVPSDLLLPRVTDEDGSETITSLTLVVRGLPGDGSFDPATDIAGLPAGASVTPVTAPDGSLTLTITMEEGPVSDIEVAYGAIELTLPADFSTANRSDLSGSATSLPITLDLRVGTDEDRDHGSDTAIDGDARATRVVEIGYEADITLTAPATVDAVEDGDPDGEGVTVSLGISVAVDDADGSETVSTADPRFTTTITIDFTGLPAGAAVNGGTLSGSTWTGSVAEAQALQLDLPPDFSGDITANITATTPEGSASTEQTISVAPRADVRIEGSVIASETDAPLDIRLIDHVSILIDDNDETLAEMSFTLTGLPAGTTAFDFTDPGLSAGSFTTDPGGTLTFTYTWTGTGTPPENLVLSFPTDYSTTNPATSLVADMSVTTRENGQLLTPVTAQVAFTITEEGDVSIDDTMPDTVADETDGPTALVPVALLKPVTGDDDGSETLQDLVLTVTGLPGDGSFTVANGVTGLPAGALTELTVAADGSATLVITLAADDVGDVGAAYAGIALEL